MRRLVDTKTDVAIEALDAGPLSMRKKWSWQIFNKASGSSQRWMSFATVICDGAGSTTREWRYRWVTVNRYDPQLLEVRCRLAVQETKMQHTIAASVQLSERPTVRKLAMICSLVMSSEVKQKIVVLLDLSRAHPHCVITRKLFFSD